jgi:hypothetical protein
MIANNTGQYNFRVSWQHPTIVTAWAPCHCLPVRRRGGQKEREERCLRRRGEREKRWGERDKRWGEVRWETSPLKEPYIEMPIDFYNLKRVSCRKIVYVVVKRSFHYDCEGFGTKETVWSSDTSINTLKMQNTGQIVFNSTNPYLIYNFIKRDALKSQPFYEHVLIVYNVFFQCCRLNKYSAGDSLSHWPLMRKNGPKTPECGD